MKNNIKGFEWFLPLAYKDSVAQCKFEQGDVIYKKGNSEKKWEDEKLEIDFLFQVKSPTRAINSTKGDLDVFSSNWNSKIVLEKIHPNEPSKNAIIETTQGAFFSFLWKNDENLINATDLKPCLTTIRPKHINIEFIKTKIPVGSTGFAVIIDIVSDLLISKRNEVNTVLKESFKYCSETFNCEEAIYSNALNEYPNSGYSPTLGVELFIIDSQDNLKINEEIKKVLFKGKKDQFSIQSHGLLITN
jgi:hypothetical protein